MPISFRIVLLALVVTGTAMADSSKMNVKPGAWQLVFEKTVTGNSIPASTLAKLPADQKKKVLAAMQARSGQTSRQVVLKCITSEDLKRGAFSNDGNKTCKRSVVTATETQQKFKIVCTGENPGYGTANFIVDTPANIHGEIEMTHNAGEMKIRIIETGRWLGPSCSGVTN